MHHVNGITALAYARDRHSFATSDLARIQDQQRLLSSALTEAIHSGLLANPVRLSSFISASLSALTVDQGLNVSALADQMRGISAGDVTFMTVPLANLAYQTPTGELAVQWDGQARALFRQADERPDGEQARAFAGDRPPVRREQAAPGTGAGRGVERDHDRRPVRGHRRGFGQARLPGAVRPDLEGAGS